MVTNPFREVRDFVRAALIVPVERDHTESDRAFRRRRIVAVATLLIGAGVLAWSLRIEPGDPLFYVGTLTLAAVWLFGAFASGPLHLGRAHTRVGSTARPLVQPLALGVLLLAVFLSGALVVAQIPVLRNPVEGLLAHADQGSLALVAVITAVNAVAEEVYFRGALYAGVGRRHAVAVSTVLYALVTATGGIVLLTFAAACLGLVVGLQRRVTGGVLAPIITHLTWSLGMLFLLPPVLAMAT